MAFLPQKFRRAKKQTRSHFPAHNVRPLIDEQWQVPVGLNPASEQFADDSLGSRPDDEGFVQLSGGLQLAVLIRFQSGMGDHRALLGEAVDMLRLALEKAHRDEEREVGVLVTGCLEHGIQGFANVFPDGIAPRFDNHATAYRSILGQVRRLDYLLIPLGIILFPGG